MTAIETAIRIAATFGCRVGIFHNGNDGPGNVWEAVAESQTGGFPSTGGRTIHNLILPNGTIIDDQDEIERHLNCPLGT